MGSYLILKALITAMAVGGGYFVVKKVATKEAEKDVQLDYIKDVVDERVEEDLSKLKRNDLVNRILHHKVVYADNNEFKSRLLQVHKLFNEQNFKHPRAHTFYSTMLPKLLKIKDTKAELAVYSEDALDTDEMYQALKVWMDEIIENKIDALEGEAEINAKVITLLTK